MADKDVIVRFPPSPTGLLHVGSIRTAIYNWLYARKMGGKFILRIEDTDRERSKKEFEEDIFDSLRWFGLDWDNEGEEKRQSENTELYKVKIQELIKNGSAYISEEIEGENKQVVRFHNPGGKIKFQDLIRGEVEMGVGDLGDFIIAKNIEEPLYHLAVVVDDIEAGITHVIRGEDHISNTPRQILIIEALGSERPIYAHIPLVLDEDRAKLSKRKHGEKVSVKYYRELGFEKEALINFLSLIGWNPGTEQEIFTLNELIQNFDLSKVQKKGGIFNIEKLDWVNREHILRMEKEKQFQFFISQFQKSKWGSIDKKDSSEFLEKLFGLFIERIHRWNEVGELLDSGEYDYLFLAPELDIEKIAWKNQSKEDAIEKLENTKNILEDKEKINAYALEAGKGNVFWPLRYALSGREKSPDPLTLISILGHGDAKQRVEVAIEKLKN